MTIKAIIKPDKVYINIGVYTPWTYFLFDGINAIDTNKPEWKELPSLPKNVTRFYPEMTVVEKYKLLEWAKNSGHAEFVPVEFFDDEDSEQFKLFPLYEPVYSVIPAREEPSEFTITQIATVSSDWKFVTAPKGVQYLTVDEIENHPVMLQDKSCSLSIKDSFDIIRNHVKLNFDRNHAEIESDYNFHFKVGKKIQLCETESYKVMTDVFSKRPKEKTKYRDTRSIVVLDIATEAGKYGPVCEPFAGSSHEDLNINIEKYLKDLMEEINRPLKDCPHCKGKGVIE